MRAYVDHQEELRKRLAAELAQTEEFREYTSEERIWTNYDYIEVFDQLAQYQSATVIR